MKYQWISLTDDEVLDTMAGRKTQVRKLVPWQSRKKRKTFEAGTVIWVKEWWASVPVSESTVKVLHRAGATPADENALLAHNKWWTSPYTMPKWSSRLVLEITDVREHRVKDITDEECFAEGVRPLENGGYNHFFIPIGGEPFPAPTAKECYRKYWDTVAARASSGKYAWRQNPRCVALTYRAHQMNINDWPQSG